MLADIDIGRLLKGDRNALSRAITLIESHRSEDRAEKWQLLQAALPHTGNSLRIAVTGAPGVGKSSFIDRLGMYLIGQGHRVGVLAIDPSSKMSGGSILGDRTRMSDLSAHPDAFIRPSPSASTLGGVAARSREVMLLMEAAGFDVLLIETVGVGQSEVEVRFMVDYFMLLIQPGSGDDLQGIKRGIMEMADLIIIHKSDGDHLPLVRRSFPQIKAALHLLPQRSSGLSTDLLEVSSLEDRGFEATWNAVKAFVESARSSGFFEEQRIQQNLHWLEEGSMELFLERMEAMPEIQKKMEALRSEMIQHHTNPIRALNSLDHFLKELLDGGSKED